MGEANLGDPGQATEKTPGPEPEAEVEAAARQPLDPRERRQVGARKETVGLTRARRKLA